MTTSSIRWQWLAAAAGLAIVVGAIEPWGAVAGATQSSEQAGTTLANGEVVFGIGVLLVAFNALSWRVNRATFTLVVSCVGVVGAVAAFFELVLGYNSIQRAAAAAGESSTPSFGIAIVISGAAVAVGALLTVVIKSSFYRRRQSPIPSDPSSESIEAPRGPVEITPPSAEWVSSEPIGESPAEYRNSPSITYRADIDGLRAIAIIAVVLYHAFPNALPGGFTGVDIFFVISGYLISSLIWKGIGDGTFSLREFYRRRVVRLFPALTIVLGACAIAGWWILAPPAYAGLGRDILAAAVFGSNVLYWHGAGYFTAPASSVPLTHLWSLAVEEQFYLFYPLLLLLLARRRVLTGVVLVVLLVGSFLINLDQVVYHSSAAFYLLPARFWELDAGGLIAWLAIQAPKRVIQALSIAGLGFIVLSILGPSPQSIYPGWWALAPVAAGVSIIAAGTSGVINRVLSTRPMVSLGRVSYPLYLWHFPILVFARIRDPSAITTPVVWVLVAISVVLAYATRFFLELPARRYNSRRSSHPMRLLLSGMAIVALVSFVVTDSVVLPQKGSFTARQLASYVYTTNSWRAGTCFLNPDQGSSSFKGCVQRGALPLVVVYGDSHAAQYMTAIRSDSVPLGFRVAQFTASQCPPIVGYYEPQRPKCEEINNYDLNEIRRLRPYEVIIGAEWSFGLYTTSILDGFEKTLALLKSDGVERIVVMGNVPDWSEPLPTALYAYSLQNSGTIPNRMTYDLLTDWQPSNATISQIATDQGVQFVDPIPVMCNAAGCLTKVGNALDDVMQFDQTHLTDTGGRFVVSKLETEMFPGLHVRH